MLDLNRLARIRLRHRPDFQRFVGGRLLEPMYRYLPGVDIRFENFEAVQDAKGPVIFAMNHTDRFNYFPFQWYLWRKHQGYTAAWVKGKYYEVPLVSHFLEAAAQIPVPSRGYVIARDFKTATGRNIQDAEYEAIRVRLDALMRGELAEGTRLPESLPAELQSVSRDMLGVPFDAHKHDYFSHIRDVFAEMMARFVALNQDALDKELNLIIFPQGTRSIRLSKGHIGIAQMAMYLNVPIVPVGCNGCDRVYPGNSPFPKRGAITYRFGDAITPETMAPYRPKEDFAPFNPADEWRHRDNFLALVDVIMHRINGLLDPCYQFAEDLSSDGVKGTERFL